MKRKRVVVLLICYITIQNFFMFNILKEVFETELKFFFFIFFFLQRKKNYIFIVIFFFFLCFCFFFYENVLDKMERGVVEINQINDWKKKGEFVDQK